MLVELISENCWFVVELGDLRTKGGSTNQQARVLLSPLRCASWRRHRQRQRARREVIASSPLFNSSALKAWLCGSGLLRRHALVVESREQDEVDVKE